MSIIFNSGVKNHYYIYNYTTYHMRTFLKSKIHKATVTDANLNYVGSITIDKALLKKSDMMLYEQVMAVNNTNGNRIWTYIIEGEENSGIICMNGAAAHLFNKNDEIIIMTFESSDNLVDQKMILVDPQNKFVRYL